MVDILPLHSQEELIAALKGGSTGGNATRAKKS